MMNEMIWWIDDNDNEWMIMNEWMNEWMNDMNE